MGKREAGDAVWVGGPGSDTRAVWLGDAIDRRDMSRVPWWALSAEVSRLRKWLVLMNVEHDPVLLIHDPESFADEYARMTSAMAQGGTK